MSRTTRWISAAAAAALTTATLGLGSVVTAAAASPGQATVPTPASVPTTAPPPATAPLEPQYTGEIAVTFVDGSTGRPGVATATRAEILDEVGLATGADLTLGSNLAAGAALVEGAAPEDAAVVAAALEARPEVESAVAARKFFISSAPNDPDYSKQWDLAATPTGIDAPGAWSVPQIGAGVNVAVIDTGILAHPDLGGAGARGRGLHVGPGQGPRQRWP